MVRKNSTITFPLTKELKGKSNQQQKYIFMLTKNVHLENGTLKRLK